MTRAVALLRGINVGGKRKVSMADLRTALEDEGYQDVETYVQSGNVVFTAPGRHTSRRLEDDLERCVAGATGFDDVAVVVRTASELARVVEANPYDEPDGTKLHVFFLKEPPAKGATDGINAKKFAPEAFAVHGKEVYLHLPNGIGRSKLAIALKVLDVPLTARNWKTVTTLLEMATG